MAPAASGALDSGTTRLYAYHAPALEGGSYDITVTQDLALAGENVTIKSSKQFSVKAPQYSLPPDDIHSVYPPQGHADDARVLPHIVLEDPHLPWERQMPGPDGGSLPNRMPWLGLLTFKTDEPRTASNTEALSNLKCSNTMSHELSRDDIRKLPTSIWFATPRADLLEGSAAQGENKKSPEDLINFVFLGSELFQKLFSDQLDDAIKPAASSALSLEKFKYMSHVRVVHTGGMARAGGGVANDGDDNELSIVVSPRSGPSELSPSNADQSQTPVAMVVHLVSLEGIAENPSFTSWDALRNSTIALVSLYSWSYTALPPDSDNYLAKFNDLKFACQPLALRLNPTQPLGQAGLPEAPTVPEEAPESDWLLKRLSHGYSVIKYRPLTGEETVGLYHGPLTPFRNTINADGVGRVASNDGSDLQIIDQDSGLPDLSYHLSWQLGRGLASSDRAFSAAMMRFRARVYNATGAALLARKDPSEVFGSSSKGEKMKAVGEVPLDRNHLANLSSLASIHQRWSREWRSVMSGSGATLGPSSPNLEMLTQVAADHLTGKKTRQPPSSGSAEETPKGAKEASDDTVDEEEDVPNPASPSESTDTNELTDWSVISQWVINKMLLLDIPTVYMFPEPDVLPQESVRTFYVDQTWMDVLIDGALSVANHGLYTEPDYVRRELKRNINNKILSDRVDVQIPRWGFLMRSKVVEAFPDLVIRAPLPKLTPGKEGDKKAEQPNEIARMTHLAADTLLCLFDRCPDDFVEIPAQEKSGSAPGPNAPRSGSKQSVFPGGVTISQPPHQQRFSVGEQLTATYVKFDFKMIGSSGPEPLKAAEGKNTEVTWTKGSPVAKEVTWLKNPQAVYDWDSSCLRFPAFSDACSDISQTLEHGFKDSSPNSAIVALQLMDEPLRLVLSPGENVTPHDMQERNLPLGLHGREKTATRRDAPASSADKPNEPTFVIEGHEHQHKMFSFPREVKATEPPALVLKTALSSFIAEKSDDPGYELVKNVYPLGLYHRTIPTTNQSESLDLVFSINARLSEGASVCLQSLTILVPAGRDSADLLRVTKLDEKKLTVLPRIQMVGKGWRWRPTSHETAGYNSLFKSHMSAAGRRTLPSTCLMIKLVPKGDDGAELIDGADLSFIMAGTEINSTPSADVRIIFLEKYAPAMSKNGKPAKPKSLTGYLRIEKEVPLGHT